MKILGLVAMAAISVGVAACGTLEKKTLQLKPGDPQEKVVEVMGPPQDRQFRGKYQAWQYCVSGAGFGYNDHRIIWLNSGQVTGITSYRTSATGCTRSFRTIRWESVPDAVLEVRSR